MQTLQPEILVVKEKSLLPKKEEVKFGVSWFQANERIQTACTAVMKIPTFHDCSDDTENVRFMLY